MFDSTSFVGCKIGTRNTRDALTHLLAFGRLCDEPMPDASVSRAAYFTLLGFRV